MRVGIAADHGGFTLKEQLTTELRSAGHEVVDFGAATLDPGDDYPDVVIPLAQAVAKHEIEQGIALCGSGVGASVAASKVSGVHSGLIVDVYSAHQGVKDDYMNVICLGGRSTGYELARDLVHIFLNASYKGEERFRRRLAKIATLETTRGEP